MKIAIDYDGTYTRDPELWDTFIANARARGHELICVSNRAFEVDAGMRKPGVPMLYAGDEYKDAYAKTAGHVVDVWIDDIPGTVTGPVSLP